MTPEHAFELAVEIKKPRKISIKKLLYLVSKLFLKHCFNILHIPQDKACIGSCLKLLQCFIEGLIQVNVKVLKKPLY